MARTALASIAVFLISGSAVAHHSYGDYDRNSTVALEGAIKRVLWANPHVMLTLEIEGKGEYLVEWLALNQLSRQGIEAPPVKQGDHLVITGSINRKPEKHILTLVRDIRRPSDGWQWTDSRFAKPPGPKTP